MRDRFLRVLAVLAFCAATLTLQPVPAQAEKASTIERNSRSALADLLESSPAAKGLAPQADAVLVFADIVKGGLIIGGQYGEGTLFQKDAVSGYYSSAALSYGLQAGIQKFGYAVFFVGNDAFQYLDDSDGWEIGSAPNLVVVDKGAAGSLSSTTLQDGVYVFFFDQKGLMAGLGIQGTKITKINPD
jgi:lipid-binding SYLF domain-containing protein